MAIYFAITSLQIFRKEPPALRAVSALVLDMKKEIPRVGISIKPTTKTRAISSNIAGFLQIHKEEKRKGRKK
jgi:hypothetical protein